MTQQPPRSPSERVEAAAVLVESALEIVESTQHAIDLLQAILATQEERLQEGLVELRDLAQELQNSTQQDSLDD